MGLQPGAPEPTIHDLALLSMRGRESRAAWLWPRGVRCDDCGAWELGYTGVYEDHEGQPMDGGALCIGCLDSGWGAEPDAPAVSTGRLVSEGHTVRRESTAGPADAPGSNTTTPPPAQ